MSQTFRHPEILETARRQGKVTVEGLAEQFGVTLQSAKLPAVFQHCDHVEAHPSLGGFVPVNE